jgi:DNA-binding GntR family transcriptional regulator
MDNQVLTPDGKPLALTDWVYEKIKDCILNLVFQPGCQLQVEQLATQMGISRTPVREALLRLERDGFIQVIPRVGFFVTKVTSKDLEYLYEVRELLESRAVCDAVEIITDKDLAVLDQILTTQAKAVGQENLQAFLNAEIAFHAFLTDLSPNPRLRSILESFRDLTYRWRKLSVQSIQDVRESFEEHSRIKEAIRLRNGELAAQLMCEHIRKARDRISKIVEQSEINKERSN